MKNLIEMLEGNKELTTIEQEALALHNQLTMHKQMVGMGLAGMCVDLYEIKNREAYKTLGFESFGDYTEQAHGIKERQAYKYIRVYEQLGIEILHSNAKIGVTKLLELASLDKDERQNVLEAHTVDEMESMNVDEFKRVVDENRKLREQISFLENTPPQVKQEPLDEVKDQIRKELLVELTAEREIEVNAIRKEVEKNKNAVLKETKDAYSKKEEKLKAEIDKLKNAKENAENEAKTLKERVSAVEEKEKNLADIQAKIEKAEFEKAELEKKIKTATDPEMARFKFLFESWQTATANMMEQKDKLTEEQKVKVASAIRKAMEVYGL